jgi:hypothetical protein
MFWELQNGPLREEKETLTMILFTFSSLGAKYNGVLKSGANPKFFLRECKGTIVTR